MTHFSPMAIRKLASLMLETGFKASMFSIIEFNLLLGIE
ncbi:hypothetical protein JCM19235_5769 [Vibrio maritimus]|uniref:Uncharacterized protein n=1 Tax=Vibrio maritimus TaxID=990268 RepID=A0A090RP67_9VIBR|nr:hypothetical protein JCM19235_5769 [Vibrio maritimus]